MAKKTEKLQELKGKVENFDSGLEELSDEELNQVAGGLPRLLCSKGCTTDWQHNKCICPY